MRINHSENIKYVPLLPDRSSDREDRVEQAVQGRFEIKRPGVKRRGLDTSNLKRETGPFLIKGIKYLAQLIRRMPDDIYKGLRNAVDAYNRDKSEGNLDIIIRQIEILKKRDDFDWNDPTLVQIANQAIGNKLESLLDMPFHFRRELALDVDPVKWGNLHRAISVYNQGKSEFRLKNILRILVDWVRANPEESEKKCNEIQIVYYQLASGLADRSLYELFALLRTGKTLAARIKITELEERINERIEDLPGMFHERIDLPQISLSFSFSPHKKKTEDAISNYNRVKTLDSLRGVFQSLKEWHYGSNSSFNRSNALKVLRVMSDLVAGKTKKELCKEWDSYIFASRLLPAERVDAFVERGSEKQLEKVQFEVLENAAVRSTRDLPVGPSLHPESVIERNTYFRAEEGENCYIVAFVNPIAPWSHTELVFVKGEKPVTGESFDRNPNVLDGYFNGRGELIQDIHMDDFSEKNRPYVKNVIGMILEGKAIDCVAEMEREMSFHTFQFLKLNEFLDEDFVLKPQLLCQRSPLWEAIDQFWELNPDYADFLKAILATPIQRSFHERSFLRRRLSEAESIRIANWIVSKKLTASQMNSSAETVHFLSADWAGKLAVEDFDGLPQEIRDFREWILYQMITLGEKGETPHREYLGIGAEADMLDQYSQDIMGVRIADPSLVKRMKQIAKRRQKELQKGMNIFGAVQSGIKSMVGEYSKMLVTKEEKIRHVRQALIDNLLTDVNPNSFLPDEEEPRYRLELYESGGDVYRKWIEDPNGQFCMMKTPCSRDSSGDYIEGEYVHNSHVMIDGKLKSIKGLDKEKLTKYEKGNLIFKMDGTLGWEADAEFGQYFKKPNEAPSQAEKDLRTLYPTKNIEKHLLNGETEWCGSYAIRILHGAYFYHYFPPSLELFEKLESDFIAATGYRREESGFEGRHAKILYTLASEYAKRIVDSEAGQRYFEEMSPDIQLTPRATPDMIQEFLSGKGATPVRAFGRALKTLHVPKGRDFASQSKSMMGLFYGARGATAVLGLPTASLKFGYNAVASTTGLVADLATVPYQAWLQKKARIRKSGVEQSPLTSKISTATGALGKRLLYEYVPLHLATDAYQAVKKQTEINAFE